MWFRFEADRGVQISAPYVYALEMVGLYVLICSVCTLDGFAAGLADSFAGGHVLGVCPKAGVYTLLGVRGVFS